MKNIPHPFFPFQTIRRVATIGLLGGMALVSLAHAEMTITACAPLADQTTLTAETFLVFDDCPTSPVGIPTGTVKGPEPHPATPATVGLCTSRVVSLSRDAVLPPFAKPLVAPDATTTETTPSQTSPTQEGGQ